MPIDKSLQQEYEDNVIPFPYKKTFKEELEDLEKEKLEKEKETKKHQIKRLVSHDPEALTFEFWFDRWQQHEFRDQFKTLKDFISWSLANEDQSFSKGGLASLRRKIR